MAFVQIKGRGITNLPMTGLELRQLKDSSVAIRGRLADIVIHLRTNSYHGDRGFHPLIENDVPSLYGHLLDEMRMQY